MFFPGNLNIKDKRVDRMLAKRRLSGAEIYYSPFTLWLLYLVLMLSGACYFFFTAFFLEWYPLFLLLLAVGYFVAAGLNTSFAITNDALIAVNPNFPFRRLTAYPLKDIQLVTFDEMRYKWHYLFGVFGSNFIRIQTAQKTRRHFCSGLEIDCFDENFTEKTIDDLHHQLKERNVPTLFNLDE